MGNTLSKMENTVEKKKNKKVAKKQSEKNISPKQISSDEKSGKGEHATSEQNSAVELASIDIGPYMEKEPKKLNEMPILNGYTYFLNDLNTTFVTVGFWTQEFTPIVKISATNYWLGPDTVYFTQKSWKMLCSSEANIRDILKNGETDLMHCGYINSRFENLEINFIQVQNMKTIMLSQNGNTILLNEKEFDRLMNLKYFINVTLIYNHSIQNYIQQYFENYMQTCEIAGVDKLEATSFTPPVEERSPINYFRLFTEISFYIDKINSAAKLDKEKL